MMEKENQILMQLWTKRETSVFDIRTSHLAGISSGKAEEPFDQNKRSKNQNGFGVTVTYAHSVGFYFVIRIV